MVRLFRGARGRGIPGFPMMPGRFRHPPPFEPEYHDFGHPNFRGGMSRAFPRGQTPLPLPRPPHLSPTRMIPPNHPPPSRLMSPLRHTHPPSPRMIPPNHPLSSRMIPPLPPRDLQIPPPRERTRSLPLPRGPLPIPPPRLPMHPHMSPVIPGPPFQRPIPPHPSLIRGRGRGGLGHRGVKRLGGAVNGRSRKTQKRKEITEGAFYCEMCDRGWKTQEKLDEHLAEHQVCGRDGCTFTAHPKIILKHVEAQHDSGLYHRIVFTENPDDVAKWINERKSRFPTKVNVEKKEAQRQEMIKRGERITNQNKPFANKRDSGSWWERKQKRKDTSTNKRENDSNKKCKPHNRLQSEGNAKWRDPDAWRGNLPQFPGTKAFPIVEETVGKDCGNEECPSDDDLWDKKVSDEKKVTPKPLFSSVLASLMENYGSDITDEDEDIDNSHSSKDHIPLVNSVSADNSIEGNRKSPLPINSQALTSCSLTVNGDFSKNTVNKEDSDSGPEECAVDREDKSNVPILITKNEQEVTLKKTDTQHANKFISRPKPQSRQPLRRHQLSLLEKLLSNEIRHERNVILQCVNYVVKNNFLGSGNLPSAKSSTATSIVNT